MPGAKAQLDEIYLFTRKVVDGDAIVVTSIWDCRRDPVELKKRGKKR